KVIPSQRNANESICPPGRPPTKNTILKIGIWKYEDTLNVEVIVPTKRVDKVFKILYDGQEQILHIEFETGYDDQLKSRLLVYNANFYRDYHLPVMTIVIYPFKVTMAVPPLHIPSILTFHFQTVPFFEQNAEDIVRQHVTCMYPIVPTMQNVHDDLI